MFRKSRRFLQFDRLLAQGEIDTLIACATHQDVTQSARRRRALIQVLGTVSDPRAIKTLCDAATDDSDALVRALAVKALGDCVEPNVRGCLIAALTDTDVRVRSAAVVALFERDRAVTFSELQPALADSNWVVRERAAEMASRIDDPAVFEVLIILLKDSKSSVRIRAAQSLARRRDKRALPQLRDLRARQRGPFKVFLDEAIRDLEGSA